MISKMYQYFSSGKGYVFACVIRVDIYDVYWRCVHKETKYQNWRVTVIMNITLWLIILVLR